MPLAGLVDTAILGHVATAVDLGAVGIGAAVLAALFWVFSFLRAGTTSLVGRALGAGDERSATRHLQRAALLAAALSAAWLALQWLLIPAILHVLAAPGAARIDELAQGAGRRSTNWITSRVASPTISARAMDPSWRKPCGGWVPRSPCTRR